MIKHTLNVIVWFLLSINFKALPQTMLWVEIHRAADIVKLNSNAYIHVEVGWCKIRNGIHFTILDFVPGDISLVLPKKLSDSLFYYLQSDTLVLEEGLTKISYEWGFKGYKLEELLLPDSALNIEYLIYDVTNDSVIKRSFQATIGIPETAVYDTATGQYIKMFDVKGIRNDEFYAYAGQKIVTKTNINKTALRANYDSTNFDYLIESIGIDYLDSISFYKYNPYIKNPLPSSIHNIVTNIRNENNLPKSIKLYQNFPNPFNPTTKINYTVAPPNLPQGEALVTLKVFDILGNEVATLVNEEKPAGNYEIEFDGSRLSSGIYFYVLNAGNIRLIRKMCLIK